MSGPSYLNSVNLKQDSDFPYLVLEVINDESYPRNPGFQVMHWHEDLQFIYVLEGEIEVVTLSERVRLRRGGMRGMLHGICRGACAAPADLRRAALSRGSRSGRLSCPAGAGGTCGGTPAGVGGGGRGRAF